MNERAWFTLMVRGVGLALLGVGLYSVGSLILNLFFVLIDPWVNQMGSSGVSSPWDSWEYIRFTAGGPAVLIVVGAYLVFGGRWLIDRFCREVAGRCARCGYDLSGGSAVCPECNVPNKPVASPGGGP
jgi:hypothetical protein